MTNTSNRSSNIFLFYGEDDFSIKRKIAHWKQEFAKKYSSSSIVVLDPEMGQSELIRKLDEVFTPSLFSDKKLIICRNCLPAKAADQELSEVVVKLISNLPRDYFLVLHQSKLDRRLTFIKKILSYPMEVTEFKLPHGKQLDNWIANELKKNQAAIDPQALELLSVYLGRDLFEERKIGGRGAEFKQVFDLWLVHNEIEKLVSRTKNINIDDVKALIKPKLPENIFELSDQIISGHKDQALQVFENIMAANTSDEKSEIIRIVGLLAEQFRSLVTVGSLSATKNQQEIADLLGWSPGRVFINLKLAKKTKFKKLKEYLANLLSIDKSIKTGEGNPHLLISLFIEGS